MCTFEREFTLNWRLKCIKCPISTVIEGDHKIFVKYLGIGVVSKVCETKHVSSHVYSLDGNMVLNGYGIMGKC